MDFKLKKKLDLNSLFGNINKQLLEEDLKLKNLNISAFFGKFLFFEYILKSKNKVILFELEKDFSLKFVELRKFGYCSYILYWEENNTVYYR